MKQRLVGAIVLVALAVIFLPMLLDGSGHSGPRDIAIEIPEEPQPPANRLEDSRDLADTSLAGRDDGAAGAATAGSAPDGTAGRDPQARDATAEEETAPQPEGDTTASADGSAQQAQASGGRGDTAAQSGAGQAADGAQPAAGDDGWIVQVGSFSRETNALVLRDRLRESGFDSFVERTESGDRTLWRVRIGPLATREEADRLSERLAEQRGEPALVMSHP